MIREPQGPQAARLRQRQYQLARRFQLPADRLPGSLSQSYTRCGKASCHCADGRGHAAWTLTFMVAGKRRSERMPREGVAAVGKRGAAGRQFQAAGRDVLAANAQLLVLSRPQRRKGRCQAPRRDDCGKYAAQGLGLQNCRESPGDGRECPQIPARALGWSLLLGGLLREGSFRAIEALVRSPARRALSVPSGFGDDALAYFTERLEADVPRRALAGAIRQAKRNKAFDQNRFIGLALDGTTVGRRSPHTVPLGQEPLGD